MSLTNYENGVAMVKRLRTTALQGSEIMFIMLYKVTEVWTSRGREKTVKTSVTTIDRDSKWVYLNRRQTLYKSEPIKVRSILK
jgi:hypothetical protein